jgi:hypothetical protein
MSCSKAARSPGAMGLALAMAAFCLVFHRTVRVAFIVG